MPTTAALAVATAEGFGINNAIPTLSNNPGDLKLGDQGYGVASNGSTVFGTLDSGWAALEHQLSLMVNGGSSVYDPSQTLAQAGSIYSGGDPDWANNVASALGVSPDTTLGSLKSFLSGDSSTSSGSSSSDSTPWYARFILNNVFNSRTVILVIGFLLIAGGILSFALTGTLIGFAGDTYSQGKALNESLRKRAADGAKKAAEAAAVAA